MADLEDKALYLNSVTTDDYTFEVDGSGIHIIAHRDDGEDLHDSMSEEQAVRMSAMIADAVFNLYHNRLN